MPIKITSVQNMSFANSETKKQKKNFDYRILMNQLECGIAIMTLNMIQCTGSKYCWSVCLQPDCMYFWSHTENAPIRQDVDIGKLGPMWPPMPSKDEFGHKYTEAG